MNEIQCYYNFTVFVKKHNYGFSLYFKVDVEKKKANDYTSFAINH